MLAAKVPSNAKPWHQALAVLRVSLEGALAKETLVGECEHYGTFQSIWQLL